MRVLPCAALGMALLAGCAKEKPAVESAPPPPPAAPTPVNLADVAGNWSVTTMPETSDSVLVTYTMHATAADTGWTITFPGRKPMAIQIMAMGDSITTTVPTYQSVLRKATQVSTQGVMRLIDGKLVGTVTAHYATAKADSVVHMRTEGTRAP
ncbi:MAG: hypothetical protein WBQ26_09770 [Gemmatimonadaceae bacterium]